MAVTIAGNTAELPSGLLRPDSNGIMQLPDEMVDYSFAHALSNPHDAWTPLAEAQAEHLLARPRLQALQPLLNQVRGQVAAEREVVEPRPDQVPLHPGFIDGPQKLLEQHRRKGDASDLGRALNIGARLREEVDRVVILGAGGPLLAARALFSALMPAHHNELPPQSRAGKPRFYFEGHGLDNDSMQDLLDMLENTCIDPELRDERWGVVAVGKGGDHLETLATLRLFRTEAARFYGHHSPRLNRVLLTVTGAKSPLRDLAKAEGQTDDEILTIPENVGSRFSVFTTAGLLPAAAMGLDVRAILLGAASMTRRFLEEPFERNPVLQMAAVNFLSAEELGKNVRVLAFWTRKLESLGNWFDHLIAESLGKQGRGPTPLSLVFPRDLHSRGQQLLDGPRDKMITQVLVRNSRSQPISIGMSDRNEDGLNVVARKNWLELQNSIQQSATQAHRDAARPIAELNLPMISEHVMGQLMQLLMLATVVESRLMGLNPYSEPGMKAYRAGFRTQLGLS